MELAPVETEDIERISSDEIPTPVKMTIQSRKKTSLEQESQICIQICWECFKNNQAQKKVVQYMIIKSSTKLFFKLSTYFRRIK